MADVEYSYAKAGKWHKTYNIESIYLYTDEMYVLRTNLLEQSMWIFHPLLSTGYW